MTFTQSFLDVLGRWQRGWKQDPKKRTAIALVMLNEARLLPCRFRRNDGVPLFRKRHLYRREDQRELVPLFVGGVLDEGSPTSWSTDIAFAEKFDQIFDEFDPEAKAGAIFRHLPQDGEIVLNIRALWEDPDFVKAAEEYRQYGGVGSEAIFHFRYNRDQHEVILQAPLRLDEIFALSGRGGAEELYATLGVHSDHERDTIQSMLAAADIDLERPRFLTRDASHRVVDDVLEKFRARVQAWLALRTPGTQCGNLEKAFEFGKSHARTGVRFKGWSRLLGREGLMVAKWSDGTVVYRRPDGAYWLY
ncbi:hypothetical protein ACHMW7_03910 [Aminobacter sp. UC22_36]|uniref:hypothetical protein n=1 Tax=Aminobacter sp. UC22_36 TaxID=3374549 RepID=UPI0037566BA8